MCPACMATVTMAAAGGLSVGGVAAFIAHHIQKHKVSKERQHRVEEKA